MINDFAIRKKLHLMEKYRYSRFGDVCASWDSWLKTTETPWSMQQKISHQATIEPKNKSQKRAGNGRLPNLKWPRWCCRHSLRGPHNSRAMSKLWTLHHPLATNDLRHFHFRITPSRFKRSWQKHLQMPQLSGKKIICPL